MRGAIEQAWAARLKSLRSAIRLKYSLQADEELNRVLDDEQKKFFKSVQQGKVPAPVDLERALRA